MSRRSGLSGEADIGLPGIIASHSEKKPLDRRISDSEIESAQQAIYNKVRINVVLLS